MNSIPSFGTKAKTSRMAATDQPTRRLATPVAVARPTALLDELMPGAPIAPATTDPSPSASTPRLMERMSARTQST